MNIRTHGPTRIGLIVAATAALLMVAGCAPPPDSVDPSGEVGALTPLTLVSSITGSSFLGVTAAVDQGIFEENGVDLEIIKVKSSAEAAAAVASGQADLAAMVPEGVVAVVAAGGEMKMIGSLLNQVQHRLEVSEDIRTAADFEGRQLGVVGPGNGGEILAKAYLAGQGVDLSKVTFVAIGPQPAQLAALTTGQISGAMLVPPYDVKAEAMGMHALVALQDAFPGIPGQVIAGDPSVLESKADVVAAFMRALTLGSTWVVDEPNDAVSLLMADAQIDRADAQAAYDRAKDAYALDAAISPEGLADWLELSREHSELPRIPEESELLDSSFLPSAATS